MILWLALALARAEPLDPSGVWTLEGRDTTRESYDGSVLLQPWGPAFDVTWHTSIGDYQGVALVVEDHLYAAWGSGPGFGLAVYTIGDDQLDGTWVLWRDRGPPGVELGTPRGRIRRGLVGTWEVDGHAPGNPAARYRALLTIEKQRRTWLLTWDTDGDVYQGVGVRRGDVLVVGWAYDAAGGLVSYAPRGDALAGRWAIAGERRRGRERLERR